MRLRLRLRGVLLLGFLRCFLVCFLCLVFVEDEVKVEDEVEEFVRFVSGGYWGSPFDFTSAYSGPELEV